MLHVKFEGKDDRNKNISEETAEAPHLSFVGLNDANTTLDKRCWAASLNEKFICKCTIL